MKDYKNIESEKVLINQMVLDPSIIINVYDIIKPAMFYSATYGRCYEHLLNLQQKCTPIDAVSFMTEASDIQPSVISEILDSTYTSKNYEYFANIIKDCYLARTLQKTLTESLEELTESNSKDIVSSLMQKLGELSGSISACEVFTMQPLVAKCIQKIDEAIQRKAEYTGYETGLKSLDEIISGIQNEFIIIGARPSLGKTALGEQIALHTAGCFGGQGVRTGFIELEMSAEQLTERALANVSRIGISKFRSGILSGDQLKKIMVKAQTLADNSNFVPITCNTRKIEDIVSCLRKEVRTKGLKIAFIDHIGLIRPSGRYASRWEGVEEISNTLQQLQRELKIPIIALSQVGRNSEEKENTLASLRGSGAIEQDADTIIFIERERQKDMTEMCIPAKLNVLKNRNGSCGTAEVEFHPREVLFEDVVKHIPSERYA